MELHPDELEYDIKEYRKRVGPGEKEESFSELLGKEVIQGRVKFRGRGEGNWVLMVMQSIFYCFDVV